MSTTKQTSGVQSREPWITGLHATFRISVVWILEVLRLALVIMLTIVSGKCICSIKDATTIVQYRNVNWFSNVSVLLELTNYCAPVSTLVDHSYPRLCQS